MKKLILLFLFLIPLAIQAYDANIGGIYYNFYYNSNSQSYHATVTYMESLNSLYDKNYLAYKGDVVIPAEVNHKNYSYPVPVTAIDSRAFHGCKDLTSITIPASVKDIGKSAFTGCHGLTAVHISDIEAWCKLRFDDSFANPLFYAHHLYENDKEVIDLNIPNGVTTINSRAFAGCSSFNSISIPESVTNICGYAFLGCANLTSVEIPNNVTNIDNDAFQECNVLTSVTINSNSIVSKSYTSSSNFKTIFGQQVTEYIIGNDVTSIGGCAFYGCTKLSSIEIPNSVTSIGSSAFKGCTGLTFMEIPNSVTSIGSSAFNDCTGLTCVSITDISAWCNISFNTAYSNPLCYAHNLFLNGEKISNLVIPNNVTNIGNYAFSNCTGLTSVVIPNSVTSIGSSAFKGCTGLTSMEIPYSVNKIDDSAFLNCSNLKTVKLNSQSIVSKSYGYDYNISSYSSLKNIFGTQVKKYVIGDNITEIGCYAFYGCTDMTSIDIPKSIKLINKDAFSGCNNLSQVNIHDISTWCNIEFATESSTEYAYQTINTSNPLCYSQLYLDGEIVMDLVIPESVTTIKNYAFMGCSSLTSVSIPKSVTSIGKDAFSKCDKITSLSLDCKTISSWFQNSNSNVKSVYLGKNVKTIESSAFSDFKSMTSITIPSSVNSIGKNAFSGCTALQRLNIEDIASWCNINFSNYDSNPLYNAKSFYVNDEIVKNLVIPSGVTSIPKYAFSGRSLASVTIPSSVKKIDDYAFYKCYSLTSVVIGNNVTSIGGSAFYECTGLTSVEIPNKVTSIGGSAFYGCTGLTSVVIGNGVKRIDQWVFHGCKGLTSVEIPNSVTSIGENAFAWCTNLTSVKIPNSVTSIAYRAFADCTHLKSIDIPDNVTSIGGTAFPNTTTIYVNEGTTTLLTLWGDEYIQYTPYAKGTSKKLEKPVISVEHISPNRATLKVNPFYSSYTNNINGNEIKTSSYEFKDLLPERNYNYTLKVSNGTKIYSRTISVTTPSAMLTTLQPRVASPGNVVVAATSNIEDSEANVGFEWRRTDWTDDFISNKGGAYMYEGTMEGYIRNLNTEKLWKVRPYYTANNGKTYYGEWVGLDPTDTSYFIPTVHTYEDADVEQNTAMIKGYMMRGSDNVTQQGFKYWKKSKQLTAPKSSIPADAVTVNASGNIMEAELTELEYGTEYGYASFVSTSEGETFYGEVRSFTTGEDITGIEELSVEDSDEEPANIIAIYNMNGQLIPTPQKGLNIVKKANGQTIKIFVK